MSGSESSNDNRKSRVGKRETAVFNGRNRDASRNNRLALRLVQQLAAILDGMLDFTEGMRCDHGIRQQQQRCDEQRKALVSIQAVKTHFLSLLLPEQERVFAMRGALGASLQSL